LKITSQHGDGGGMNGHQTGPTKLGCPDGEHGLIEIDILELQIEGFRNAQTRDAEQTQKTMKDPWPQRRRWPSGRQLQGGVQQAAHFLLRIQVRSGSSASIWHERRRGDLGERIGGATVTGKAAYEDKAPCPLGRTYRRGLFHPLQCEPYRDGGCLP